MRKKDFFAIFAGIIILGSFLRFYNLGENSFVADEFLDMNSSYAYSKTGEWQAWDFNLGEADKGNINPARDHRAWIYKIQVAKVLGLTSTSEASARTVSAVWGILSIILVYFVATYFTGKKEIGLLSAFLSAVSVSGLEYSRHLRMYAMFFPMFLAFSWMLFRFLEEEYQGKIKLVKYFWGKFQINLVYLVPAVALGILSFMTHQLTVNIIFVLIVYAILQSWRRKGGKIWYFNKYKLILLGVVSAFVLANIFLPRLASDYMNALEFFNYHFSYFSHAFSDYSNLVLAFLFAIWGGWYLGKQEKLEEKSLWLSVSFFTIFLSAVFLWRRNVGEQYIYFAKSFLLILVAAGIFGLAVFLKNRLQLEEKNKTRVFLATLVLTLLILPNWGYFFLENNTYRQNSDSDSPDYKKIFTYVKKELKEGDILITRNFRNFYWRGAKVRVFDFGGELSKDKLSLEEIQSLTSENPSGWLVVSDNDDDYVSNGVMDFAAKNLERVSNSNVRGKVLVYRWGG